MSFYSCKKMIEDSLEPLVGYWMRIDDFAAGDVVYLHFKGTVLEGTLVCLSPLARQAGFVKGDVKWHWADIMTLDPDHIYIENLFSSYLFDEKNKKVSNINKFYRLVLVKLINSTRLEFIIVEDNQTYSIFWEKLENLPFECL
jgi:hypothetical protein